MSTRDMSIIDWCGSYAITAFWTLLSIALIEIGVDYIYPVSIGGLGVVTSNVAWIQYWRYRKREKDEN